MKHLVGANPLSTMSPQDRDFLKAHPILPSIVQEILDMIRYDDNKIRGVMNNDAPEEIMSLSPEQQVWKFLETFLPEYFGKPPKNEPDYDINVPYEGEPGLNYRNYKHLIQTNYAVSALGANS